jgi:hypothetical protein
MLVEGAKTYISNNPDGVSSGSFTEQRKYIDTVNAEMSKYNYVLGVSKEAKFTGWTILGWLITAFAISLGAPFWFDLLNKLMQVRNSVKIPISGKSSASPASSLENNTKAVG